MSLKDNIFTVLKKILPINLYHQLIDKIDSYIIYKKLTSDQKSKISTTIRIYDKGTKWSHIIKTQTPNESGLWNNTFFKTYGKADIHLGVNDIKGMRFYKKNSIKKWWIHTEPPTYINLLNFNNDFIIKRIDKIYTSSIQFYKSNNQITLSPPYVFWYIGYSAYNIKNKFDFINYNYLLNLQPSSKINKLVVIASAINDIPGHSDRIRFIEKLASFSFNFEIWGSSKWNNFKQYKGFAVNKLSVYINSKYVLVIENEKTDYYWSEKFSDAILSFSIPLYYGCNNMKDFFPEGSFIEIDIHDKNIFSNIQKIVSSDYYEKHFDRLIKAREIVLNKQNFFAFIDSEISKDKN